MANRVKYARQDDLVNLQKKVDDIADNHLSGIKEDVSCIKGKLKILIWGVPVAVAILGLVVAVVAIMINAYLLG